jgi:oligopeptide transport system substrate-binding protein
MKMSWMFIPTLLSIGHLAFAATPPTTAYLPLKALPVSLDPAQLKIANDSYIFRQIAEGLFSIGEAFQIVPRLAENVEWSTDQKRLTIKIRPAKFSDGTAVTAKDVADSLDYCIRNADKTLLVAVQAIEGYVPYSRGRVSKLSGLNVAGPSSLEIKLSRQAPLLLDDLAQGDCHIVKPSIDGSRDLLKGALGSGPYILKSTGPTDITLTRNPSYSGPLTGPDTAVFRSTSDYGQFDALKPWVTMATTDLKPLKDPAFNEIEISELGTYQLVLNNSKAPFNDVRVRRAVAQALDYQSLAKKMNWSEDTLQAGLVPLGMRGFIKRTLPERKETLKEATRLLKDAGYTAHHPLRFTVLFSSVPEYAREAAFWHDLFSGVPIIASTEIVSHADRNARMDRGDFQAARWIKYAGSTESHRLLLSYLSHSPFNPTRSHETKCDRLIEQSVSLQDREARFQLYSQADSCLMNQAILVPLASLQSGYVLLKKPWKLSRTNRYLLYPYWISEWRQDGE